MALMIVIGSTRYILFVMFKTLAMQIAPKATCERPSPINEKRLSTKVTPSREEQREIKTPTIKAYLTKAKLNQKLPDDFQTAEYLLSHGFIDKIVPRTELKAFIVKMLHYFGF